MADAASPWLVVQLAAVALVLAVRLSSVVVHQDGRWLMRGVKRSS